MQNQLKWNSRALVCSGFHKSTCSMEWNAFFKIFFLLDVVKTSRAAIDAFQIGRKHL